MKSSYICHITYWIILLLTPATGSVHAQVVLDGTMGPKGQLSGPNYQILSQYGKQRGGNLFHSFFIFNVNTRSDGTVESATFSGPDSVQNIISRVTGRYDTANGPLTYQQPSQINGTLRSTIPNANLFLINPYGVIFGPNASLDVTGSFHVSTADYLRLGENERFYADPTKPLPVLGIAPVEAFGFLGNTPAAVRFWGSNLQVPAGKTLAVVAGDVKVGEKVGNTIFQQSTLAAPGGRVEITAVASPGEVVPTAAGPETRGFQQLGAIDAKYGSKLSVEGEGGGAIFIRGGKFTVDNSTVNANTRGAGSGGGIDVQAKELDVTQDGEFRADNYGSGSGPGIRVEAETINLDNGGFMAARARGAGSGGDITLSAGKVVTIGGPASDIATVVTGSLATGNGGTLRISTPELNVVDGGLITSASLSRGRGADVVLNVDRLTLSNDGIIDLTARGTGRGGNLAIIANNLTLNSGGNIDVSTRGTGRGGDLTITANDIKISGSGQDPSGLYMVSYGAGDAGKLMLSTKGVLAIDNGGVIRGDSNPNATGRGADISIDADRLELTRGGSINVNTFGAGQGGNLAVAARSDITITGNAGVNHISGLYGQSGNGGNAGTITVTAPSLTLSDGGTINGDTYASGKGADISIAVDRLILTGGLDPILGGTAISSRTVGSGQSGDIAISASQSVTLDGQSGSLGSHITTGSGAAGSTAGPAGNIRISTPSLQLTRHAAIDASTVDGPAGAIDLTVDRLEISGGLIDASSIKGNGQAGRISITAGDSVTVAGIPGGPTEFDRVGQISSAGSGTGSTGEIAITAPNLVVTSGGRIGVPAVGDNTPAGTSGTIRLQGDRIQILNGGYVTALSSGPAKAGDINVTAKLLEVGNGGRIEASSTGAGNGGSIVLQVDRLMLSGGGQVLAQARGSGQGGKIRVTATEAVTITGTGADTQSSGLSTNSVAPATGNAGDINVTAKLLEVSNGGHIETNTTGAGDGGRIVLQVDRLIITGAGANSQPTGLTTNSVTPATGKAGDINVTAKLLEVGNGGYIQAVTTGAGDGGSIVLQVDRLILSGGQVLAHTRGSGQGGKIQVAATEAVTITGAGADTQPSRLSTNSLAPATGKGGTIRVSAPVVEINEGGFIESETTGAGDAGTIELQVDRLVLTGGASVATDTSGGSGRGGAIRVNATGSVTVSGQSPNGVLSRLRASSIAPATGPGGEIQVTAPVVELNDSDVIMSATYGTGDGGHIELQVDRLLLNGGGALVASTVGKGRGGDINVTATETINFTGGINSGPSGIYATSRAPAAGNAGNITLTTDRLTLNEGTTITAESEQTSGGNIVIKARETRLYKASTITSSVQGNEQSDGGNVTLNGDKLIVYDGGKITARANQGRGGRITINENVFLYEAPRAIPDVLDASSQVAGNQGIVTINAQDLNINSTLVALPATYLDASKLLSNRCTAPQTGGRSSFVVHGRGTVPPGPEGPAPASARECLPAAPETAEPALWQAPAVETTETYSHFGS